MFKDFAKKYLKLNKQSRSAPKKLIGHLKNKIHRRKYLFSFHPNAIKVGKVREGSNFCESCLWCASERRKVA